MHTRGTPEAIEAAAERLVAKGEKPSVRAVRAELGGGSPNTINAVLGAWKAKRPAAQDEGLSLSVELQRVILGEIAQAVAAARADLGEELAEVKETLIETGEEYRQQTAARETAELLVSRQAGDIERQTGVIAALQRELVEARQLGERERAAAETARREAVEATVRLEGLPTLRSELEKLRERGQERAAEVERQVGMIATLERELAEARQGTEREREAAEVARREVAQLTGRLGELATLQAELQSLRERVREQTADQDRQAGVVTTLERAIAEARRQMVHEQATGEETRRVAAEAAVRVEMLPGLQEEIADLRARYDEERNARLRAEVEAAELRGAQAKP
jgi:colicin import membrane protein